MANGFFLGGMAEGIESSNKQALAERTLAQDAGLRTRGLDIQEKQLQRAEQQDYIKRGDELISTTMSSVSETIKSAITAGKDPTAVLKAVAPMIDSAKQVAQRIGRDPRSIDAQVQALTLSPTATETATAAGKAEGTKAAVSQTTAEALLTQGQPSGEPPSGIIIDPAKRAEAENALRKDFQKATEDFGAAAANYRNIKGLPKDAKAWTAADDIAATFAFLKILDPASVASPGEQATVRGTGSVTDQIATLYNKLLTQEGAALGPSMRENIRTRAETIYKDRESQNAKTIREYSDLAKRRRLNPRNIITGLPSAEAPSTLTTPGGIPFRVIP